MGRRLLLLLLLLLLTCGGCRMHWGTSDAPLDLLPADGGPVEFEQVRAHAGSWGLDGHYWLLPLWRDAHSQLIAEDGETLTSGDALELGLLGFPVVLPLWYSADFEAASSDGLRGRQSVHWSPFWAHASRHDWPDDALRIETAGVPLLYWNAGLSQSDVGRVDWHQTLWVLGPGFGSFELAYDEHSALEGWAFAPLLGAGLGPLLWTSAGATARAPGGPELLSFQAHGPLLGLLGYFSFSAGVRDVGRSRSRTAVLGGILWWASSERVAGVIQDARYGPLWGMFGWGWSGGDFGLRVLWFPITF